MEQVENKPREHIYDETIKNLESKDCKALAGLAFPNIDDADDILLQFTELAMTDMKRPDYVAKIRFGEEWLIIKEAIYMSSVLYKHPYEKGKEDGIAEGMEKGERNELIKTVTKQLTKKFGIISDEIRAKIKSADSYKLELIIENIFELDSLDKIFKYFA